MEKYESCRKFSKEMGLRELRGIFFSIKGQETLKGKQWWETVGSNCESKKKDVQWFWKDTIHTRVIFGRKSW